MRDIKFRAWDKDRNMMCTDPKWVEYRHLLSGEMVAVNYNRNGKEQELTILQYTGLKDSKGVEIYEGDVVTGRTNTRGEAVRGTVVYEDAEWLIEQSDDQFPMCCFGAVHHSSINIIGNIHQHPELLTPSEVEQ
jgi:uncharacterized phage protein (TIGR01671 family)